MVDHKTAFSNELGRTDVEGLYCVHLSTSFTPFFFNPLVCHSGCCWWGRGVFRNVTRGRCIFGQLNYYIGKRAATEGRPSLYPNVDFCKFERDKEILGANRG